VSPDRSAPASRHQRWGAVSALTPLRRWRTPLLRLVLWFGSITVCGHQNDLAIKRLEAMKVIALARWTLLPDRRRPRYLLFETNWSGADATYIPDFGTLMRLQWRSIWGNTKGFPGSFPTTGLLAWVARIDWGCDHFWSDYDDGSTTRVVSGALQLQREVERFLEQTRGAGPDEFAALWERFATDVQGLL
jgi:hypothetical protein